MKLSIIAAIVVALAVQTSACAVQGNRCGKAHLGDKQCGCVNKSNLVSSRYLHATPVSR